MTAEHRFWLPLGDLLVDRGLLSRRQLDLALAEQQRTGRRLGEVLVAFGFVSQEALAKTLLDQVGLGEAVPEAEETSKEPRPSEVEPPSDARPLVIRLDADRRWRPRTSRVAELESLLADFERRSAEIEEQIAEIRTTLASLTPAAR